MYIYKSNTKSSIHTHAMDVNVYHNCIQACTIRGTQPYTHTHTHTAQVPFTYLPSLLGGLGVEHGSALEDLSQGLPDQRLTRYLHGNHVTRPLQHRPHRVENTAGKRIKKEKR